MIESNYAGSQAKIASWACVVIRLLAVYKYEMRSSQEAVDTFENPPSISSAEHVTEISFAIMTS